MINGIILIDAPADHGRGRALIEETLDRLLMGFRGGKGVLGPDLGYTSSIFPDGDLMKMIVRFYIRDGVEK